MAPNLSYNRLMDMCDVRMAGQQLKTQGRSWGSNSIQRFLMPGFLLCWCFSRFQLIGGGPPTPEVHQLHSKSTHWNACFVSRLGFSRELWLAWKSLGRPGWPWTPLLSDWGHYGRASWWCLSSSMLVTLRTTFTATSRWMSKCKSGYHSQTRVMYKIHQESIRSY